MIRLDNLHIPAGAHKKSKRIGRGTGSGHGKTACKGTKGQTARGAHKPRLGFEGGQMPLQRRIPKRGFFNPAKKKYAIINLSKLQFFPPNSLVTSERLYRLGIVKPNKDGVKILADGEILIPLKIKVEKITQPAIQKIIAAGGEIIT